MWLCGEHKQLVDDWNDRKMTEKEARTRAFASFTTQHSSV
jgi:hypothetical protein